MNEPKIAQLANDPILAFYFKMSKSTEYETILPTYSETSLRLAFANVLSKMRPFASDEVVLYRKLLLLHYSVTYKSLHDLQRIMPCFSLDEVYRYRQQSTNILKEWSRFTRVQLRNYIYKDALFEMLCEWKLRYEQMHGEVNRAQLHRAAGNILKFLGGDKKLLKKWLMGFFNLFSHPNYTNKSKSDEHKQYTQDDLNVANIFEVVKPRLNSLLYETVKKTARDNQEQDDPVMKKLKLDGIKDEYSSSGEDDDQNISKDEIIRKTLKSESVYSKSTEDLEECENPKECDTSIESPESLKEPETGDLVTALESDLTKETEVYCIASDNSDDDSDVSVKAESDAQVKERSSTIVDYDTAMHCISELQAYSVVNGNYEAIGLLDRLYSIFRKNPS